jgi:K+-sensing histidine kinase KdpD
VSDQGNGIPPGKLDVLFDRFRPADTLSRAQEGCGIGLSLTKALAELLGGRVCVESRPGHGSHFYVELPITAESGPAEFHASEGLTMEQKVQIAFSDIPFCGIGCAASPPIRL